MAGGRVRGTGAMIAGMDPVLREGRYVFATSDDPALAAAALATLREEEGLSLVLPETLARDAGLPVDLPMAWITLEVHSALDGVGLTAAVAETLARAGIACNVVAGHHHDHLFVPFADGAQAVAHLRDRAAGAAT